MSNGFTARRAFATAIAMTSIALAPQAGAVDAVLLQEWDTTVVHESLAAGETVTASSFAGQAASMANNPALNGSAWAHVGHWWSLELPHGKDVTISVDAQSAPDFSPGVAVWAAPATVPFDRGTQSFMAETSTAGFGTPHSFNAFGPLGDPGTLWMQQGQGGNVEELLGYAISGPSFVGPTGWGETITTGVHDMRTGDDHAAAVTGSSGAGFVDLEIEDAAGGWYVIYVGGTDPAKAGGLYDLTVTVVPEPSALLVQLASLVAICASPRGRRAPRRH